MALENATYISDLNASNPLSTDAVSQADDHLRLIKNTIKNTFPNVTGPVTKTQAQINDALEKSGGTMTGTLVLAGAPSSNLHAATKQYVDTQDTLLVPKTTQVATGTGLTGGGDLTTNRTIGIAVGGVTNTLLAISSVTTDKIADANVTTAKIADSAVTPAKLSQKLTQGTAQNSTSGTSIDFTGIPSWAKKITIVLAGVSTNGSSLPLLRAGTSGGIATSGYQSAVGYGGGAGQYTTDTTGFILSPTGGHSSGVNHSGVITLVNVSGNTWAGSVNLGSNSTQNVGGGSVALGGTLDRVRLTTANGTDAFDAGSVNILYE